MKVNLNIIGDHLQKDEVLRDYAIEKIRSGLKSNSSHIDEVVVSIHDSNGSGTVNDRRCSVLLYIPGQIPVQVKKYGHNIYSAISKAVDAANHKCHKRTRQRLSTLTQHGV